MYSSLWTFPYSHWGHLKGTIFCPIFIIGSFFEEARHANKVWVRYHWKIAYCFNEMLREFLIPYFLIFKRGTFCIPVNQKKKKNLGRLSYSLSFFIQILSSAKSWSAHEDAHIFCRSSMSFSNGIWRNRYFCYYRQIFLTVRYLTSGYALWKKWYH